LSFLVYEGFVRLLWLSLNVLPSLPDLDFSKSVFSFTEILKEVIEGAKEGASVRELCIKADQRIEEETGKAFKKDKKLQKGKNSY
jgi:hypothetical protein